MAIWQYVTYLIPTSAVAPNGTLPGVVTDNDGFELPPLSVPFSSEQFEHLAADYLPPTKSWSDKVRIWASPSRDPKDNRIRLRRIERRSDGWHWGPNRRENR